MKKQHLSIFKNIPIIKTERLILRRISKSDLKDVFEYSSNELTSKYLLWSKHPDIDYTKMYLQYVDRMYKKGEFYDWGIEYNNKLIGTCGFTSFDIENNAAQLGYVFSPQFWGREFAPEACRAIIKFGFETLELNRIYARYIFGNDRSLKVMKKIGMEHEGLTRQAIFSKGEYKDVGICAILKSDYLKMK